MFLEDYKKIVESKLSPERFEHCLNVSKESKKLAQKYNCDFEKAQIAGLLHDITKEMPREEQKQLIEKHGIILTEVQQKSFKLWHAISGYVFVKTQLNIKDKDILNAIRYHTSGRRNMSKFEKIIFVSDFISEDRKYKSVEKIRRVAYNSLDDAVIRGIEYTTKSLIKKRSAVDPNSIEAYNDILFKNEAETIDD
ncbi:MAG: bis(5'-nucleosyl)-tetraphosphatase (symmetrical) YqeK [Oscillospiraceae bacterium]|jgi:predicted HD superfamily hydrolase involved in NAD metabolism|nr:bis(5'-nucleosyl)-tetraphosphatase (symmetrical) YqeK [Oscillospiraceae bacterium]